MEIVSRRDGRVVDSSGLENRYSSSELSRVRIPLSPFAREMFLYWICLYKPLSINHKNGSARWDSRTRTKKKQSFFFLIFLSYRSRNINSEESWKEPVPNHDQFLFQILLQLHELFLHAINDPQIGRILEQNER